MQVPSLGWRRAWPSTPVFRLENPMDTQRSLMGYSPQGHKESDMTKVTEHACMHLFVSTAQTLPFCPRLLGTHLLQIPVWLILSPSFKSLPRYHLLHEVSPDHTIENHKPLSLSFQQSPSPCSIFCHVFVAQSCSTLCDSMDCCPLGLSVHGIQA